MPRRLRPIRAWRGSGTDLVLSGHAAVTDAAPLAVQPDFIVGDEAVSALDGSVQAPGAQPHNAIARRPRPDLLLIAHNLGVVQHLSRRMAVMYLGRIVEPALTAELSPRRYTPTRRRCCAPCPGRYHGARPSRRHCKAIRPTRSTRPRAGTSTRAAPMPCRSAPRSTRRCAPSPPGYTVACHLYQASAISSQPST
jgi:ABC-type oligopeptide transport system ATPase subunit